MSRLKSIKIAERSSGTGAHPAENLKTWIWWLFHVNKSILNNTSNWQVSKNWWGKNFRQVFIYSKQNVARELTVLNIQWSPHGRIICWALFTDSTHTECGQYLCICHLHMCCGSHLKNATAHKLGCSKELHMTLTGFSTECTNDSISAELII